MFLLLAAFIWGFAFVAQSMCTDSIGPFTYNAVRSYIGATVLIPVILLVRRSEKKKAFEAGKEYGKEQKLSRLILGGILCGTLLCAASVLQQIGIEHTSAGKAGFITALYVVLVPVFSIFLRKKTPLLVWVSVIIAVFGLYLLCVKQDFSVSGSDIYIFCAAIVFAVHILVIDHFSPTVNGIAMSCIQFYTAAVISTVCMFIFESPTIEGITSCWMPLLYLGVFSTGVAYTLQVVMQKHTNPTVASLLLSFESVFSVLGGWMILHETLSQRELIGCLLMFAAVVMSQIPPEVIKKVFRKKEAV